MLPALLLLASMCGNDCTGTAFELQIFGVTVEGLGDMDAEQCIEALTDIEPQTPPFTEIFCVEVEIARQEL